MGQDEGKVFFEIIRVRGEPLHVFMGREISQFEHEASCLPMAREIVDHSDAFECGNEGSGSAQLSIAILSQVLPKEEAERLHQKFKRAVIARIGDPDGPGFYWRMSKESVLRICAQLSSEGVPEYLKRFSKFRPCTREHAGFSAFRKRK